MIFVWKESFSKKHLTDVSVSSQDARLSHHIAHWKHPEFLGASAAGLWEIRAVDGSNSPIPSQYSWLIGFPIWVIIYNNPPNNLGVELPIMINQARYLEWLKFERNWKIHLVLSDWYSQNLLVGNIQVCMKTRSPQFPWSLVSLTISIYIHHSTSIYRENTNVAKILEIFFWKVTPVFDGTPPILVVEIHLQTINHCRSMNQEKSIKQNRQCTKKNDISWFHINSW